MLLNKTHFIQLENYQEWGNTTVSQNYSKIQHSRVCCLLRNYMTADYFQPLNFDYFNPTPWSSVKKYV